MNKARLLWQYIMRSRVITLALAALSTHYDGVLSQEMPPDAWTAGIYESGSVHMGLMARKKVRSLNCLALMSYEIDADTQTNRKHGIDKSPSVQWTQPSTKAIPSPPQPALSSAKTAWPRLSQGTPSTLSSATM